MAATRGERQVSIECANCGREVAYSGNGRRPKYCSSTCRSRAWELRRAAALLNRESLMPGVVREVVERTVDRIRPVPTPVMPTMVTDWALLLDQLTNAVRHDPRSLVRDPNDWQELALAVRELHDSFTWTDRPPAPASSTEAPPVRRPSRQQRRAQQRQRRP